MSNRAPLDLDQLYIDVSKTAEIVGVHCDEATTKKAFGIYKDFYSNAAVAFRTTTHAAEKRDLDVRYIDLEKSHNPQTMALEAGLIGQQGRPVEQVIPELETRYSGLHYGVDLSVRYGLHKIWPFFQEPMPVEEFFTLRSMPRSMKAYAKHFADFDLAFCPLLALDYLADTVNLYFPIKNPNLYPPEKIAALIRDVGFNVPSQDELDINSRTVIIYYTFNWDSPKIERLSFGMAGPAEAVPVHIHPLFQRVVTDVPIRAGYRQFTYCTAYGPRGDYLKIEADYTGTIGQTLGSCIAKMP